MGNGCRLEGCLGQGASAASDLCPLLLVMCLPLQKNAFNASRSLWYQMQSGAELSETDAEIVRLISLHMSSEVEALVSNAAQSN